MTIIVFTLALAAGAATPASAYAGQVTIFDNLRPYFSCYRSNLDQISNRAGQGVDPVVAIQAADKEAKEVCEVVLAKALAQLAIVQPTTNAPGAPINAVRWRRFDYIRNMYESALAQEALEANFPQSRGILRQSGSTYSATETLLPYFSCFEDAFRKNPNAFLKKWDGVRLAETAAENACISVREPLLQRIGIENEEVTHTSVSPFARIRAALAQFQKWIITYQLELNDAQPLPLFNSAPPLPPPPAPASPSLRTNNAPYK